MSINKHGRRSIVALCSMTVLAVCPMTVVAAEERPPVEEMVVTAQLREQSLQDVPISINVLGAAEIADRRIADIQGIMYEVPGFSTTSFASGQVDPAIRGSASLNDSPGVDQSVAMFIDGVYIGQPGFFGLDLFDIERIEVLKGPQGTLFGRNVTGGALNIITRRPPDAFGVSLEGTVGNYGRRDIQGFVGGPMSESLSGQIAFSLKNSDGFYTNIPDGKDVDAQDRFSVRGKLRYDVSDTVDFVLSAEYLRDELQGVAFKHKGDPFPFMGTESFGPSGRTTVNFPGGLDNETWAYTGTITVDTNIGTITSITGYRNSENLAEYDVDGTVVVGIEGVDDDRIRQFSQELRLIGQANNIEYVGGLYFMNSKHDRVQGRRFDGAPGSVFRVVLWPGPPVLDTDAQDIETTSYAAYGEITYTFDNGLSLTGGIRYTHDEKTGTSSCTSEGVFILCPAPALTISHDGSWDAFTPRFVAQYHFDDDVMVYGSISRGFKSGGFPLNISSPEPEAAFKPEYANSYEVGIKSRLWDRRLRANLAIFRTDFTDLQVLERNPAGQTFAANAGDARTQGVELDLHLAVTDAFRAFGNYAYMDSEYRSLVFAGNDVSGNTIPLTPEHSYNVGAEYTWNLRNAGVIAMRTNVVYKSSHFLVSVENDPNRTAKLNNIVNAGIMYTPPGRRWELSLWGKNLTDQRTWVTQANRGLFLHQIGSGLQTWTGRFNDPRTWGATVRWNH